jgi:putative ABC transport system permease protein
MDISNAQEIFGRQGRIDHIDLIIEKDRALLESDLPSGLRLTDKGARKSSLKALLYSFQLNLAAMSLLALLVGIFLIYNFSMFSALSRREDLSLLMTLGAKRKELVAAFLLESLILGALGAGLGIGFGYLVALLSMERVSSTISDIYFFLHVDQIRLTANIALSGLAVGFAATLTGAGTPAIEVAGTPPVVGMKRRSIEDRAQSMKGGLTLLGTILFLASILAAWASRFSIFWGFLSAFGVTLAFALLTPSLLWSFCRYASIALKKATGSLTGFMAARNISASLSRTSIAVAALAVALSMTIGVDTMIHSFRESVRLWLEGALQGDLYISPSTTKWEHTLPPELVESLMKDPDMAGVERYATHEVYLDDRPVRLRVIDGATLERFAHFHFLDKGVDPWEELKQGGLFISESLAYKSGLSRGDTIELETPNGPKSFPIAAMIRDYSSDQGAIQMDRETFLQSWDDRSVQSMALFLKPGVDPQGVRSRIMAKFPGLGRAMATNQSMRENILTIFDKTFAPTGALKGVTLVVALLGVAAALMAIFIERSNEMKLLSYLGMRPGQLMVMNLYQALLMGLAAFLISVVCGIALTYIITLAINYRSFGWSVDIRFDIWIFLKTFLITGLACLASSIYPGWKILGAAARGQVEGE